jgi:hypothetical protein
MHGQQNIKHVRGVGTNLAVLANFLTRNLFSFLEFR